MKSLDFVGFWSTILLALAVIGLAALAFGPWAGASALTARLTLTFGLLAFWLIGLIARNASAVLAAQADQISALQRELAGQRPAP